MPMALPIYNNSRSRIPVQGGEAMLIKANGIQMNYEWSGQKEAEVAVISHSLGTSLLMWHPQMMGYLIDHGSFVCSGGKNIHV